MVPRNVPSVISVSERDGSRGLWKPLTPEESSAPRYRGLISVEPSMQRNYPVGPAPFVEQPRPPLKARRTYAELRSRGERRLAQSIYQSVQRQPREPWTGLGHQETK